MFQRVIYYMRLEEHITGSSGMGWNICVFGLARSSILRSRPISLNHLHSAIHKEEIQDDSLILYITERPGYCLPKGLVS